MTDSNREAFERHFGFSGIMLKRNLDVGYYLNVDIENMWDGWQAATAHNKEKLVKMDHAIRTALAYEVDAYGIWQATATIIATLTDMIGGE